MTFLSKISGTLILLAALTTVACSNPKVTEQGKSIDSTSMTPTDPNTIMTPTILVTSELPKLLVRVSYAQPGASNIFRTFVSLNLQNGSTAIDGFGGLGCKLTEMGTGRSMLQTALPDGSTTDEILIYGLFNVQPGEMAGGFAGGGYATYLQPVEGLEYQYDCRFVLGQTPTGTSFRHISDLGLPTVVRNVGTLRFSNNTYVFLNEVVSH
ncbi:MAG: hypothetical protein ACXWQE_04255 [Bdellovibrionales bacterium]